MDNAKYKKHVLDTIKLHINLNNRDLYSVYYGSSLETIKFSACFAHLKDALQNAHNMVYLLTKNNKEKIAYFLTLKSIQNIFNKTFTIKYTNLNTKYILIEICPKNKELNENIEEIGFIILGVLLRSIDQEYRYRITQIPTASKMTNIITIVKNLYTYNPMGSHGINKHILEDPEYTNTYFNNIIKFFGKSTKTMQNPSTIKKLDEFRAQYARKDLIGYDYAYSAILNILETEKT